MSAIAIMPKFRKYFLKAKKKKHLECQLYRSVAHISTNSIAFLPKLSACNDCLYTDPEHTQIDSQEKYES